MKMNLTILRTLGVIFIALIGAHGFGQVAPKAPGSGVYDITEFGAVGDGVTVNTKAIQSAIDACAATSGGMVLVPGGNFVSGTIELKDNVTLHLASAGTLLGSIDAADYVAGTGVPGGNGNKVMIYAANRKNVRIEGNGTIDGRGAAFYTGFGDGTAPRGSKSKGQEAGRGGQHTNRDRPHLMIFSRCEDLSMQDVFLKASAYHCVRILSCERVNFDGVRIYNRVNKNNDGFHFSSCRYVKVSNCEVLCQDDACALFGSNQFVTVTNCTFSTRWSIFRFGGGNPQNIAISNCLIYDTYGCPIKFGGGSQVENLSFSNIVMRNVTGPISVQYTGGGRGRNNDEATTRTSFMRNLSFNNIRAYVVEGPRQHPDIPFDVSPFDGEQNSCLTFNAFGNAFIENVSLNDVHITYTGGGTAEQAARRNVPEMSAEYFGVWGQEPPLGPPSYGMYARNVRGLRMQNVSFQYENDDVRPAVVFDNVQDASVANLSVEGNENSESAFRFVNVKDVYLDAPRLTSASPVFLQVEGSENSNIVIDGGDHTKAGKPLSAANGGNESSVKIR